MCVLLFNAAFGLYIVALFHTFAAFLLRKEIFFRVAIWSVGTAFAFHTGFLVFRGIEESLCPLIGLRDSLAFFAWTVTLCFLIAHLRFRIRALGMFFLPLVSALMLSTVLLKSSPLPDVLKTSWLIHVHTFFLLLAYGMFFVTFSAGVLYLLQERELKMKRLTTFYHRLPSLNELDELFFKFLILGFTSMTVGLLLGVIRADQEWLPGWYRDPKVVAATATWMIYLVLIYMRTSAGWRGRKAAWLNLAGFLSVLFTYFGVSFFGGQHSF